MKSELSLAKKNLTTVIKKEPLLKVDSATVIKREPLLNLFQR
jgi:uncharacterized protein YcaQ